MNTKRFLIASIAVFGFVFVFEFLVHGLGLKSMYENTAHMWRSEADFKMIFMLLSQLGFSVMTAFIFTRNYEDKGMGEGVRFGLAIGLLLAVLEVGKYGYMPIPFALVLAWMAAALLKGVGSGVILSWTYKK